MQRSSYAPHLCHQQKGRDILVNIGEDARMLLILFGFLAFGISSFVVSHCAKKKGKYAFALTALLSGEAMVMAVVYYLVSLYVIK